jgi:hypothetical protein
VRVGGCGNEVGFGKWVVDGGGIAGVAVFFCFVCLDPLLSASCTDTVKLLEA